MKKTTFIILFFTILNSLFSQINSQEKLEIYFENNSAILSKVRQDKILEKLKVGTNSTITSIVIDAHCDSKGSIELNDKLSQTRAASVLQLLINNGVSQSIISQNSFGKSKLKYSIEKDSLNRRAEITIHIATKVIVVAKQIEAEIIPTKVIEKKLEETKVIDNTKHIAEAEVGELIVFESIQFYPGQAVPLPKSLDVMEGIADILHEYQGIEIEIQGHICCISSDDDNISTKRAKCVYDFLIDKGISKKRLTYKGYGRTRPRTDESTPELTQMNRRVEIKITKK